MTQLALTNTGIKTQICNNCNCAALVPVVSFTYTPATPVITFSQASTWPAGDSFAKVLVHVYDKAGHVVHGIITTSGGNTGNLSLTGFDLSTLDIKATVISTLGCSTEMVKFNLETSGTTGSLTAS